MKFIPHSNKIVVEPFKKEKMIISEEKQLIESGKVIAVGVDVGFVEVGDTLFFDSWGCSKVTDAEGVEFFVVSNDESVVLGKYAQE